MRLIAGTVVLLLTSSLLCQSVAMAASETAPTRGNLIGSQFVTHPEWFVESFLDIAEDAASAGDEGRHVILFFESPGCPYCNKMIEENFKHSSYTRFIQEKFQTIALNIHGDREVIFTEDLHSTEKELARLLNIRFTPTMLFLDTNNKTVLRVDGYRSVEDFKYLLDYVDQRAYKNSSLAEYLEQTTRPVVYTFRDHPNFEPLSDLSAVRDKPLMVIFEDDTCSACDALHENILSRPSTRELMARMRIVRLDARSGQPIVDAAGYTTTPERWARDLDLTYRPGIVMFDGRVEVFRIDAFRWTFHFQQALRYVVERQWQNHERYSDFARTHREATLDSGEDVNVQE